MSHQTIIIREEDTTLRIEQVIVPSRDPLQTSTIKLPVGGGPLIFTDENDGLLLTLDKDGNIISEKGFFELSGQAEPDVSPAGKMRFYFDSGLNKLRISENGGAFVGVIGGAGDVVGPGSATDEALARFDGATGKLVQNSLITINDAGLMILPGGQGIITTSGGMSVLANGGLTLGADGANQFNVNNPSTLLARNNNTFQMNSDILDGASAVGFIHKTTLLDKDTFTAGALHTEWIDAADDVIMSLTPNSLLKLNLVTLDASAASRFDMGFSGQIVLRLNSNGLSEFFASGTPLIVLGQISVSADNITEIKSPTGGVKAFGFVTNTSGATSAGKGFRFIGVNNTSLWDDPDAAFLSIEPAITGQGTGRLVWKINGDGDVFMVGGDLLVDEGLVDSPGLILRARFDSDPTGGLTPATRDFEFKHVMTTGGASPVSKLAFSVEGVEFLRLSGEAQGAFFENAVPDSASAVGFLYKTTVLDKDTFTAGALHSQWLDAGGDEIMSLTPGGALTALGNPTFTGTGLWQINGLRGFGNALLNSLGQAWISFGLNTGVLIRGNSADLAAALGVVVETNTVYTTAGATLLEVWNGKFATGILVLTVDKDGDMLLAGDIEIDGDINHDGTNVGFYGTTPAAQSAAYTRNATVVEDHTLLASASATALNNNNVLAALIADLQAVGLIG